VVLGGQAVALFGLGGAGKSTTAAAFALDGEPVLSDDVVVLSDQGDHFLVQPGYPRVNLWPDSVEALFGSGDALPKITPTWNKRYLALDKPGHRFHSTPLPLGAIYILGERAADSSLPVIEEVGGNMAMISMVANTYVNYLLDPKMRKEEFLVLSRMLAKVPLRWVRPSANPSRVFELSRAIASDARCLMPSSMRIEARNAGE